MKAERLAAMTDCLLNGGRRSAEDLAARFEVSVRTIYRDVDALCASGVPVVAIGGPGGGYEIDERYRIDRSFLSREELEDLTAVLSGFSLALKDRSIERSLHKMRSLGPRAAARGGTGARGGTAPELPAPLIASLSPWGAPGPDPRLTSELRRAVADHRPVSFRYTDTSGRSTERIVEPFSVVMGGSVLYLHAWCRLRGGFRLFKVLRIQDLKMIPEHFDPLARIPVPDPFAMQTGEELFDLVLEADDRVRSALEEAFPWASSDDGAGGLRVYRLRYPLGSYLERILLSLGPGLRVLEPVSLRLRLRRLALEIAESNGPGIKTDILCQGAGRILSPASPMEESMEKLIAYCGLDCAACDARKATLTNDDALRARTAEKWTKEYNFSFEPGMINCTGCRQEGPKIGHCAECAMRSCGLSRGVENCGACGDYAACEKLRGFLAMVPPAKANLEAHRAARA